jgi:hypothetical protein
MKPRSRTIRPPASGRLLDVAIKNANLVHSVFGTNGRLAVPGTRRSSSR